ADEGGIHVDLPGAQGDCTGWLYGRGKGRAGAEAKMAEVAGNIGGNFTGKIGSGDTVILRDALGNPANTIQIYASGWSDGGGSSLELTDARADNSSPDAWADSDETSRSSWQTVTYRMAAGQTFGNVFWNEFRLALLDAGEVLVDVVSVI